VNGPLDQRLLAILRARPTGQPVPSAELVDELGLTRLALVEHLERLQTRHLIAVTPDGCVTLTALGRDIAGPSGSDPSAGAPPGVARSHGEPEGATRQRELEVHDTLLMDPRHANRVLATLLSATAALLAIGLGVPVLALVPAAYLVYLWVFRS
jgi:hypothetical protein